MTARLAGALMRAETAEIPARFAAALLRPLPVPPALALQNQQAIYTLARGSSDAAAMVLAYEIMRVTSIPTTTLPPSVFSLQDGIRAGGALALAISQSGKSPDLVQAANGFVNSGGKAIALVNTIDSPLAGAADLAIDLLAGPEKATPATKSVACSIATGMGLLGQGHSAYAAGFAGAVRAVEAAARTGGPVGLVETLAESSSIYVIGRGSGFGVALEVALKLKECCALHAEAYSASEVLHGPLQLAARGLTVLILDTGEAATQASLSAAEQRFSAHGARVFRIGAEPATLSPAAAGAVLLTRLYPVVLATALALGLDPDAPHTLSKVTETL
ncbi:MAG: SIS domain-containing protein [Proteobacteria bacterium]|nr:SIS domain-containing protein [Pseudomonadota bacterium]